jgi:protein-S-isoprenylcysteine O-methyltransferase Ste14
MSVALIAGYAIVYAAIHSWLASQRTKSWVRRALGRHTDHWYRLAYNALAIIMLVPFAGMLAWLPDAVLYEFRSPWLWLGLSVQAIAAIGAVYGVWTTGGWHFLGLQQLLAHECPPPCRSQLTVHGMYRWVRHPVYFLGLVFLWASPHVTVNSAALFVVFSLYFYIGTYFEERRLTAEYGEAYRQYQRQVPRLLPWRGPVRVVLPADHA